MLRVVILAVISAFYSQQVYGKDAVMQCDSASMHAVRTEVPALSLPRIPAYEVVVWSDERDAGTRSFVRKQLEQVEGFLLFYTQEVMRRHGGSLAARDLAIKRVVVSVDDVCLWSTKFCALWREQHWLVARMADTQTLFIKPSKDPLSARELALKVFSTAFVEAHDTSLQRAIAARGEASSQWDKQAALAVEKALNQIWDATDDTRRRIDALRKTYSDGSRAQLAVVISDLTEGVFTWPRQTTELLTQRLGSFEAGRLQTFLTTWSSYLRNPQSLRLYRERIQNQLQQIPANLRLTAQQAWLVPMLMVDEGASLVNTIDADLSAYLAMVKGPPRRWRSRSLQGWFKYELSEVGANFKISMLRTAFAQWSFLQALRDLENAEK